MSRLRNSLVLQPKLKTQEQRLTLNALEQLGIDLTDRLEALSYIHGARNTVEFGIRSVHVLVANGDSFPEWWEECVLESGEVERMRIVR